MSSTQPVAPSLIKLPSLMLSARRRLLVPPWMFSDRVPPPPPPLPDDSPLYDVFNEFENVILTPHIGWQRVEARQRVVDGCGDNIAKFTRGEAMNIDMNTGLPIR